MVALYSISLQRQMSWTRVPAVAALTWSGPSDATAQRTQAHAREGRYNCLIGHRI